LVEKAAPTDASVIITGESGTGKELVADLLHEGSLRRNSAYIKVNCAAIPDNLLESEMFGYEKGAFTDAQHQQKGKIELADSGTIFFDEIGDMSIKTQAKMLRVLQEKKFTRLGGTESIGTDFRVIAATNRDLELMIHEGTFREDLYYRLSVIVLNLPPLRERPEDIVPIAGQFIRRFNSIYGKSVLGLSEPVAGILQRHSWPGNVRELKNIIERAVIFCEGGTIELADLPEQYNIIGSGTNGAARDLSELATDSSRAVILEALKRTNGLKGEAARLLNITRKTLYNRMKRLNLE
ncbi:MAG TPA: sigma 54-interacting transcriptional regulator, partial [Spirochaetia bacterium]|nr:sigma 54-interacting transcriptional regulator [Spirochaetia bacterium]